MKLNQKKYLIPSLGRNQSELTTDIKMALKKLLKSTKTSFSIEKCVKIGRQHMLTIEEDHADCSEGKHLATSLIKLLEKENLSKIKENFLPLQGQLWKNWCTESKKMSRIQIDDGMSVEQHKANIKVKLDKIREDQAKKAFPMNLSLIHI